jgi:hypothetical protein
MLFKCKKCGSTEVECEYEAGKDFTFGGPGANVGISNIYAGEGKNFTEFISNIQTVNQVSCDHLASGNACCPCGRYLNEDVKAVCVMVGNKQTWPTPYGKEGLSIKEAQQVLNTECLDMVKEGHGKEGFSLLNAFSQIHDVSETEKLKIMWDRQMISGKVYITRLREIGDKKQESCERMK